MRRSNTQIIVLGTLAAICIVLVWYLDGPEAVWADFAEAGVLALQIVPQVAMGLAIAGFITVLVPQERIAALLGAESGSKGLLLGSAIGAILPGGPFAAFPLIYALHRAGADIGSLIALLMAWAAIGVQRLLIFELPLMGVEFSVLRLLVSLPLPIIAGLTARWLVRRWPGTFAMEPTE